MERRNFVRSLLLGLVALILNPWWNPDLKTILRSGRKVRMFELQPGDLISLSDCYDPEERGVWKVLSHPWIERGNRGFTWGIQVDRAN